MWKSGILLTGATKIYPQGCVKFYTAFHRGVEGKFSPRFSTGPISTFHSPCGKLFNMYVTFLSLNKKVTKELSTGEALKPRSRAPYAPSPMDPSRANHRECSERLSSKAEESTALFPCFQVSGGWILKEGAFCEAISASLSRPLFVLFLPKQEKNKGLY